MESIVHPFIKGGPIMYLIAMCVVPLVVFGVVHLILARKWTLIVTLCLLAPPPLLGALGYMRGASLAEQATVAVDPAHRAEMLAVGYAEAKVPLHFGLGAAGIALVPLIIGELRRRQGS